PLKLKQCHGTCSLNLLLCPEMLAPPAPVRFHSVDYKNVLHWSPPNNGSSLQYHVQWKIYGEPEWLDVDRCQGVQRLDCDLSGVTSDPREWYYARVRAVSPSTSSQSAWALSPRFSPRMDTIISPPGLRVNFTERGIMVRVNPPRMHVRRMRNLLRYKIYIIPSSGEEDVVQMGCCTRNLTLKDLHHNSKYCLQAQTVIPTQTKSSARSRLQCGTTV
uniref:Interleukin 22 receptor, alpha 2 n=1 Tax=Salarias fasciatus TaxID=181472 RepID=A0A672JM50_SALFA